MSLLVILLASPNMSFPWWVWVGAFLVDGTPISVKLYDKRSSSS